MDDARVFYQCVAATHQIRPQELPASPVTIHQDNWAYCPAGASAGHEWRSIMPTPLSQLRRWKQDERR